MYSFAQRSDTKVFDEPLYAYYLANSKAKEYHPGADEVMQSQNQNGEEVIRDMMEFNERPIGFFKHMTHRRQLQPGTPYLKSDISRKPTKSNER